MKIYLSMKQSEVMERNTLNAMLGQIEYDEEKVGNIH